MVKLAPVQPPPQTEIASSDFDQFANEVTMNVWNHIAKMPPFSHLQPKDYPEVYESIQKALKPYLKPA